MPAVAINTGGSAASTGGTDYLADQYFSGGSPYSSTAAIANTTDDIIYQNERSGSSFSYAVPLANGDYILTLKFAELYFNAPGMRVFDVRAEGVLVLDDLDIWSAAGGKNIARDYAIPVTVTDGVLNLQFTSSVNRAAITAIQVESATEVHSLGVTQSGGSTAVTEGGATDTLSVALTSQPTDNVIVTLAGNADLGLSATSLTFTSANWNTPQTVTVSAVNDNLVEGTETASIGFTTSSNDNRYGGLSVAPVQVAVTDNDQAPQPTAVAINSGGPAVTTGGATYSADQFFSGGSTYSTTAAIAGTLDDVLYQNEHNGSSFSYAVPLADGDYTVTLKFAEIFHKAPGRRIFDVRAEGALVIDDLDIFAVTGGRYIAKDYAIPVTVTDGVLNLQFTASVNKAAISAIHIAADTTNDAPVIDLDGSTAGTGYSALFTVNGSGVPIADSDLRITDSDDTSMEGLTVTLANPKANDLLLINGTLPTGISMAAGSTSSNIILTGSASISAYQTALRQVRFDNSSASPDMTVRQVRVSVDDGEAVSSLATANITIGLVGDIALALGSGFRENVAGATAGTLSVADPEPGQTYVFSVNDSRFEVVGDVLMLKDGVRLDFERTPTIDLSVTATASGGGSIFDTVTASLTDVAETRFAAFGDYGNRVGAAAVGQLVNNLNVDFIITTGDNMYGTEPIDAQIGNKYSSFIGNYQGAFGSGSTTNRFWPSIGNHEYDGDGGGVPAYLSYFTLPGNERYYDFVAGPIHFFALNSNPEEPDGRSSTSVQAQWLQSELAASDSPYKIVFFHHPPYNSGDHHGSTTIMRWPFEAWGATAVLTAHEHVYERIHRDDNGDGTILPYFVTGLGGADRYDFTTPVAGSQVRYNSDFGTMLIQASDETITFEFISVAGGGQGTIIDSYTIDLPAAAAQTFAAESRLAVEEPEPVAARADLNFMDSIRWPELPAFPTLDYLI